LKFQIAVSAIGQLLWGPVAVIESSPAGNRQVPPLRSVARRLIVWAPGKWAGRG